MECTKNQRISVTDHWSRGKNFVLPFDRASWKYKKERRAGLVGAVPKSVPPLPPIRSGTYNQFTINKYG
jgi:hypothetical protein